ncbi:ABC transporter related protein [Denitrovibrio acetiphilus DSM 12809]|uniref:ABC transporter related protein n=1 Tax=Denitrovibrio acetiphilus (strain DSM 12809 / NBRC 114555 / N2460) TaxID=522772 RepID=D4H687_DENA2|nr:ATP-binding cassette domain-containing protein [Denitrovibrio acetiphilus]ADD67733.1 ABC transporter related protein [Denitrovibrio acetiphilus DSM 12809]
MIKLENVSFEYFGRRADSISDVSLELNKGECLLLCGRSGSGKTTITKLLNGLIPNFHEGSMFGRVTVGHLQVNETPMYMIAEVVGSVFQNPRTQFFNVDTDSEIVFGMENAGIPADKLKLRLAQTADDLNISDLLGRNIFELSGGEKQKIAFASVYAMNPDVYVLDEPSSNLDAASVNELKKILKLIKQQGKTVIVAEHRLYYLLDIADKVICMNNGRVDKVISPTELRRFPADVRSRMGLRAADLSAVTPLNAGKIDSEPVIEIRNVSVSHKKKVILKGLNLQVGRGEIIAVAGRNGAGKTTFSRALCGLHKEYTGEFLQNGKSQSAKARLKNSYMVMQDVNYQLFAESVESECSFGIRNVQMEKVDIALERLNLTPYRHCHPNTLSGGQKQRTAVAVGVVSEKEVMIFDEPTSGLDSDSMFQVSELIRMLSEEGRIVFVVTHDFEFVCACCTRVLHFSGGTMADDINVTAENTEKLRELFLA